MSPMTESEFADITASWGMSASADAVLPLVEPLQQMMAAIDELPHADAPHLPATRRLRPEPTEADDPCNAIVRWCDVGIEGAVGPLAGVRVAVKDCMAIAGLPMTAGSPLLQGFVADRDSAAVERLLGAGARIVAMTNMDDMAVSPGGDGSYYGPTLNPLDKTRTAGGSSGGSAAALHYEGIDAALGTDTGGSVRIPASWCGVIGHKPTHGLVPHVGVMGGDALLDHVGVLTRTTTDAARLLQVLAGRDDRDPRQPAELPPLDFVAAVESAPESLAGVRIGVVVQGLEPGIGVSPEVAAAFETTVGKLEAAGAVTSRVELPEHLQAAPIGFNLFTEGFATLMRGGGNGVGWEGTYWPELAAALRDGFAKRADDMSPQLKLSLVLGADRTRSGGGRFYARAANLRSWLRDAYDRALSAVDFLVLPTTPVVAHQVDAALDVPSRVMRSWALVANTAPTDLTGHPATSLPLGASDGLPVGLMFVARQLEDARLLALARSLEATLGWAH